MTRREIREEIFKLLFTVEFHEEDDREEQLELFMEEVSEEPESAENDKVDEDSEEIEFEEPLSNDVQKDKAYIQEKYNDILSHLDEIDATLNKKVEKWKTTRMPKVDLTILRLAVYEILFEEDIPEKVAINEAVELAKKYGSDKSGGFVNGALSKVIKNEE